jgi:hypothetical protein
MFALSIGHFERAEHIVLVLGLPYCVLFSVNKNPYNSVGYDNLKEIHRALVKHEISKEHTHCLFSTWTDSLQTPELHSVSKRIREMVK